MTDDAARIAENVARIRGQIADAAARSGRAADAITLVAVTKYVSAEVTRLLVEAGCHDLGESRPQLLWEKAAELANLPIRWHLIGHLQRNKVRRSLPLVAMLHSVDSPRLLAAINQELEEKGTEVVAAEKPTPTDDLSRQRPPSPSPRGWGDSCTSGWSGSCTATPCETPEGAAVQLPPQRRPLPVLLEVNISNEPAKTGFAPAEIEPFLANAASYRHVSIRGLMGMSSLEGGLDVARREFAALRQLRNTLRANCPANITLDDLSMGMSGDFHVAIEEGATIVRIGSALFE
jgi:PLP dependent protein